MNRVMMEGFSKRTVESLKSHALFRLALPPFRSFLDINVAKEIEKDRGVITFAASLHQSGTEPDASHVATLLKDARKIDQDFLRKVTVFPIDIKIQYQDIEKYRQQRIELLLQASQQIFKQWHTSHSFRVTIKDLYTETQFRVLLQDLLSLYAMETRMLSRSVRIPSLFNLARDNVAQTINRVMEQEAVLMAKKLTRMVYRGNRQ